MSFDIKERSNHEGEPSTFYEFSLAETLPSGEKVYGNKGWWYTSQETDQVYNGRTYEAVPIFDDGVSLTSEIQNDQFIVSMPSRLALAQLYRATPPSEPVYLTVRRKHYNEPEAPVYWVGTIYAVGQPDDVSAKFICRMLTASFDRNGLRLTWVRNCPHALYDDSCRVAKAAYVESVTLTEVTGSTITSPGFGAKPAGYFSGGFIEWELFPGVFERRAIETHAGENAAILGTTNGLLIGQTIKAYPGCDRSTGSAGCGRFNNLSNYGGFESMPGKSPFDGNPIFY